MKNLFVFLKANKAELIVIVSSAASSIWLMFSTFSYSDGHLLIASKAWSDFANHIPLIRSFSLGSNFPPQDPLFAGLAIRYHFIFYLFVAALERMGIRIDWALNTPSALGFFACLIMIYFFATKIFQSKAVGVLSVLFFLFNGTLSFLYFFSSHPLSRHTIQDVITNNKFSSFGPYDRGIISAFWNMNIYTNQRHLAAAFALSLFIIATLLFHAFEKRRPHIMVGVILGALLGASFFFHLAVFLMTIIVILCLFLLFPELRLTSFIMLLITGIVSLPQYVYLKSSGSGSPILFAPGYLIHDQLYLLSFINYWFYNLGLHFILIPIGFFLAPRSVKKVFLAFFCVFVIGNLFQFGNEMAVNHKFFNYFMLVGSMFSAYALVRVWQRNMFSRPVVVVSIFFLILSGVIDFFPIYNDTKVSLADYPINPDIQWIMKNTQSNAVFFNTNYLYDNASLAGRRIFLGWPYFPWSAGFDTTSRSNEIKNILRTNNASTICTFLRKNNLKYVSLTGSSDDFPYDETYWQKTFLPVYANRQTHIMIYMQNDICLSAQRL